MPTEPLKIVLDRDLAIAKAREIIDGVCPLLRELINHGTSAFRRCQTEPRGDDREEDVPPLFLYYHILEMSDGIETLFASSCANSAVPLVRSNFEALMQLEYILVPQADYQNRSLAWAVHNLHNRIDARKALHPDTPNGRQFREANERGPKMSMPTREELDSEIAALESTLRGAKLAKIESEYQERKRQLRRRPQPYALFAGPANLRELAYSLTWGPYYDMLYPSWSEIAHGSVFRRFLTETGTGEPAVLPLRDPEEMQFLGQMTALMLQKATRLLIEKFRPGENLRSWYVREIVPLQDRLTALRVTFKNADDA